jgi:hypothetical protein
VLAGGFDWASAEPRKIINTPHAINRRVGL